MGVAIYQLPHSPYCLPITRALGALGVQFEIVNVSNGSRAEVIRLTFNDWNPFPPLPRLAGWFQKMKSYKYSADE